MLLLCFFIDNGWAVGKTLAYMNSKGSPDSEDLTMDDQGFIFVCAERDNSKSSSSHLSILKYSSEGLLLYLFSFLKN